MQAPISTLGQPALDTAPFQAFHIDTLYGTERGVVRNALVIVNPAGAIEAVGGRDDLDPELLERVKNDRFFTLVRREAPVMMPALTDAHNHPVLFGELSALKPARIYGAGDNAAIGSKIHESFADRAGMQIAIGWDTSTVGQLSAFDLDEIRTEPLMVIDTSFHGAVANTNCLKRINEYVDRKGLRETLRGHIETTGRMYEEYALIGIEVMEEEHADKDLLVQGIEQYVGEMRRAGALFAHDMLIISPTQLDLLDRLSDEARDAIKMFHISPRMLRHAVDEGRDVSRFSLKLFADGSNSSRSALYYDPYVDRPGYHGIEYHTIQGAIDAMELAAQQGIRNLATHGIGDLGIHHAVLFAEVWLGIQERFGRAGQARIEHMSVPRQVDIDTSARHGLSVSPQPNFIPDIMAFHTRLGDERIARMVPLRQMLNAGLQVMIGTDGMPNSMFLALHCALDAPLATQRLSFDEALHLSTETAPQYEGEVRGTIAPGQPLDCLITTDRMVDRLTASHGLYETSADELDSKMQEIAESCSAELLHVLRSGRPVTLC